MFYSSMEPFLVWHFVSLIHLPSVLVGLSILFLKKDEIMRMHSDNLVEKSLLLLEVRTLSSSLSLSSLFLSQKYLTLL